MRLLPDNPIVTQNRTDSFTFRDKAVATLIRFGAQPGSVNSLWKIEPEELKNVEIRFPAKYGCGEARTWMETLLFELRRRVRVSFVDLPQPFRGTVLIQFVKNNRILDVAIDYSDYSDLVEESVAVAGLYFKLQFLREGYGRETIVPGGYLPDSWRIYRQLPKLRRLSDRNEFNFDVYGRFSLDYAANVRRGAVEILQKQNKFAFEGGLKKVRYIEFLREIARAKICLDLPGNGAFCHRLINYFAIGGCIVAYPHKTRLHVPLENRKQIVYCREDFSDLIEICEFYLNNKDARETMRAASREYFDLNLRKENLANYYLRNCLDRLN